MSSGEILVVDDSEEMRVSLTHLLKSAGYGVTTVPDGVAALKALPAVAPDAILSDVRMPNMDGLTFQQRAQEVSPVPVVLFSAHGDIPMAVEAIQNGAYSFLEKPFDPRRLITLLGNAVRMKKLQDNQARLEERLSALTDLEQVLIGDSPVIQKIRRDITDFAGTGASVLVTGATGTGKEVVARALHDQSAGPGAPFAAVNCAAIPADRFEETVFGSVDAPSGLMQRADGGTLFLDELTSMPAETQSKFLRVIETKLCEPLGSATPVPVDMRIVSAASSDLDKAVAEGRLREDLFYRLNTLVIELPSLSERGDDILLLFGHYTQRFSVLYQCDRPDLTPADISALITHAWPGNVRELQHAAERFVLSAKRGTPSLIEALQGEERREDFPRTLREAVARFERQIIGQAIQSNSGRMDDAAADLGIGRRTLNEKIVKLGIDKTQILKAR